MIRLFCVLLGLNLAVPVFAQSTNPESPISLSNGLALSESDYISGLRALTTEELLQLEDKPELQIQFALRLHSNIALAREAHSKQLHEDPKVQALIERSRNSILATALLQGIRDELVQPDLTQLAHERYLANKEVYRTEEKRRIAHILVTDISVCPCEVDPPEDKIRELHAKLKLGADFAGLAAEHSHDMGSRNQGGALPRWFAFDDAMPDSFRSAMFSLPNIGDISEPFKTKNGWHVMKLLEIEPSVIPPFEQLQKQIEKKIWLELQNNALERARASTYPLPENIDTKAIDNLIDRVKAESAAQ